MAMDRPPFLAQTRERTLHRSLDPTRLAHAEPVAFAELQRSARAVQEEHGLAACSDDMDMRRSMIVGIYDHAKPIKPMNGRHRVSVSETQALGNVLPRLPKRRAQASQCVRLALIPPASYVIPLRPCPPPA